MSDEEFSEFCSGYPDHMVEVTAGGEILILPPNFTMDGARNQSIGAQRSPDAVGAQGACPRAGT